MTEREMGERLKRLRKAAGLSQSQLARAAGVPVTTLRCWEQATRLPSLNGFIALADGAGPGCGGTPASSAS